MTIKLPFPFQVAELEIRMGGRSGWARAAEAAAYADV